MMGVIFFITDNIRRNQLYIEYCPTGIMLGDYYTKPQQGSRMRRSRVSILNLPKDPSLISQECVGICVPQLLDKNISTAVASTNHYKCDDVVNIMEYDTSSNNENLRCKDTSYLRAAKGLLKKVNNKVNRMNHFIQLT